MTRKAWGGDSFQRLSMTDVPRMSDWQVREWQPISTAPADMDVLIYDPRDGVFKARLSSGSWTCLDGFCGSGDCCPSEYAPTHWMPLPEPPK